MSSDNEMRDQPFAELIPLFNDEQTASEASYGPKLPTRLAVCPAPGRSTAIAGASPPYAPHQKLTDPLTFSFVLVVHLRLQKAPFSSKQTSYRQTHCVLSDDRARSLQMSFHLLIGDRNGPLLETSTSIPFATCRKIDTRAYHH